MNVVILKGRLTHDPKLKQGASGKNYTKFSVAVNGYGDKVDFINCTAFGTTADNIAKYFVKGKEICVRGSITTDKYTDKDGNNKTSFSVMVNEFDFCGSKGDTTPGVNIVKDDVIELRDNDIELPF